MIREVPMYSCMFTNSCLSPWNRIPLLSPAIKEDGEVDYRLTDSRFTALSLAGLLLTSNQLLVAFLFPQYAPIAVFASIAQIPLLGALGRADWVLSNRAADWNAIQSLPTDPKAKASRVFVNEQKYQIRWLTSPVSLERALSSGALSPASLDKDTQCSLWTSVDVACQSVLKRHGFDPNVKASDGMTPIMQFAQATNDAQWRKETGHFTSGDIEKVAELVRLGAEIDVQMPNYWGKKTVRELLVEKDLFFPQKK